MAYTQPVFNLDCNIFSDPSGFPPIRETVKCNLAMGRRVLLTASVAGDLGSQSVFMQLLLPLGTDIRDELNAGGPDAVEVPAGSGRYYGVAMVDDAGKGFANEHRVAYMVKIATPGGTFWPTPIP